MPVLNRIAAAADEIAGWRRDLHQFPELMYDLPRTAAFVPRSCGPSAATRWWKVLGAVVSWASFAAAAPGG